LRSVSMAFEEGGRRREVLCDLSLTVAPGEVVALVGRSGSGKSTLLNVIAGIDRPSAGSISVDGELVSALGERERTLFRRRRLGFVFQAFNLLPTLTVEENVLLPLELVGRAGDAGARARVTELLAGVALAVGIDVASASVRRAFGVATEAVSGRATHEITGGPRGVPEAEYRRLRVEQGVREIAPFVGGAVPLFDRPREVVQIVGIDPFAERPLRPALAFGGSARAALAPLLTRPGAAAISAGTARRLGLSPGSVLPLRVGAQRRSLEIIAVLEE